MRVLITGSSGFAGAALARSAEAAGHEVHGFDIRAGQDLRDYEQVLSAVAGLEPDEVYHLAAVAHPPEAKADPRRAVNVNVTGTLNLLEAVRVTGTDCRVLVSGSSDEYGTDHPDGHVLTEESPCFPSSPYGAAKLAQTSLAMAYARTFGLQVVACRPFMHIGPGKRASTAVSAFAARIAAAERGTADRVTHGDLSPVYDILDVSDVVAAYRMVIGCEPGLYNICRGKTASLAQVMRILLDASKVPDVPLALDPRFGGKHSRLYPPASAAKLTAATGWEPAVSLEASLAGLLEWQRSR